MTMVNPTRGCRNQSEQSPPVMAAHLCWSTGLHEPPVGRTQLARRRDHKRCKQRATQAENMADVWERSAFSALRRGNTRGLYPAAAWSRRGLRLLSVLIAQQSCLRCHVGRQVGDVLGGISVSQDATIFKPRQAAAQTCGYCMVYWL